MTRKRSNQWTAASAEDPKRASWAEGFGGNSVYLDREHALVIVLRWSPHPGRVVTRALAVSAPLLRPGRRRCTRSFIPSRRSPLHNEHPH